MHEFDDNNRAYSARITNTGSAKPLVIFKTEADKYGRDITAMSDFFDGYIQQMSLSLKEQSNFSVVTELPVTDLGIINEVLHRADVVIKSEITLIPDFDNLSVDIKTKLREGIYKIGDSRQVDGNLRAVILDENDVRVKDITLKKVINTLENIETLRSIGNQLQMRQIYSKLADIQEFQTYQIEKDRDRDIIVPFLNARSLVLEAETKESESERIQMLKEADGNVRSALNAVYQDMETTSKYFAEKTNNPFLLPGKPINRYIEFLVSDMQIATKYAGVRMQLLEYLGDTETAREVLQQYQHAMYDFFTKPVTKKGLSTVALIHDYFPYNKANRNCWYDFSQEMKPALESGMSALELGINAGVNNGVFIVSAEDIGNGEDREG